VSTLTKVFVVLNTLLSVALSVLFVAGAASWGKLQEQKDKYQTQRDAAITLQQNTSAAMNAALAIKDDEIARLARQLSDTESNVQKLSGELAANRGRLTTVENERLAFETGRTKLQEILNVTTGELTALRARHQAVTNENAELQTRNERLNNRTLELTTNVQILTDQVRNLQEKLYACEQSPGPAVAASPVTPGAELASLPGSVSVDQPRVKGEIHGEVLAINDRFAEISVGQSSGVSAGMTFMVYRSGGQYLGDLTIEKVDLDRAGGRLSSLVVDSIRRGDLVAYGLE
jgi:septal ring factor EnvC (AmiA/AmiB activator)